MTITAMISIVCFNFNKILNHILLFVFEHIHDESVLTCGPYMKSKPITVEKAIIDEHIYTNKSNLLLNWKWDFDIMGFTSSNLLIMKPNANVMILQYKKHYGIYSSKLHTISIDFKNSTITENGIIKDIMFEEICLFN